MKSSSPVYYIAAVLIISALAVAGYLIISGNYGERTQVRENHLISDLEKEYNSITLNYIETSELLFNIYVNKPDILEIFSWASSPDTNVQNVARDQLKERLLPVYNFLRKYNVRQFQFHLPDNHSFLRLHQPEKYGDDLTEIRPSVVMVNEFKEAVHGFEEGRVVNGFRNVYPLFFQGNHIGSVEISFSFNFILKRLRNEFYGQLVFLVEEENAKAKVWPEHLAVYKKSALFENFLVEKEHSPDSLELLFQDDAAVTINRKLSANEKFVIPILQEDRCIAAVFMPLENVSGKTVAYIAVYEEDSDLWNYREQYNQTVASLIISAIVLLLTIILIIRFYLKRKESEKKIIDNEELLRKLTKEVPGAIYQYKQNPEGSSSFPYASPGIFSVYEVTPEEVQEDASKVFERIHPDDLAMVVESIKQSFENLSVWEAEYRVILPQAGERWLGGEANPERLPDGSVLWHGFLRDITDSKNYEKELEEIETILNETGKLAKVGGWSIDVKTNNVVWSQEIYNILEVDKDFKVTYEKAVSFYTDESKKIIEDAVSKAITIGEPFDVELNVITAKNNKRTVRALGKVIFNDEKPLIITGAFQDITSSKEAEKALQESEARWQSYVENSPYGIFVADSSGKYYEVNPMAEKTTGYSADELKAMTILDLIPEQYHPQAMESVQQLFSEGYSNVTIPFRQKSGELRWWAVKAIKLEDGSAIGFTQDMTEKREAERELLKFKSIADNAPYGIAISDTTGTIEYINNYFAIIHGYSVEELIGKNLDVFHTHEQMAEVGELFGRLMREGFLSGIEQWHKHIDGSVFPMLMSGVVITDENNDETFVAATAIDISDRKKAEEEMNSQRFRLVSILDGTNAGTWEWNVQTGETKFNERWAEIIGYTLDELEPVSIETWEKFAHPDDLKICNEKLEKHFAGEADYYECESRMRHKSGRWVWVNDRGKVISWTDDGKPLWMYGTHILIDKQKQTEAELRKAKIDADTANRAKSEFLANMSHEIRTPMNSILGFSEVMLNTTKDSRQRGYLQTILNSGKTLLSLINDLLDLSKIEAGRMEISPMPVDIRVLIHEMEQIFDQKVQQKNLEFIIDIEDSFPANILIDEIRLRQILLNLTGNAIKFTDEGFVKISLKTIKMENDFLDFAISVSDSGIGIAKEEQSLVFESFTQQSKQDAKKFGGTGLGLAISKRLTEMMNGKISLESELGEGSTFTITFYDVKFSQQEVEQDELYTWDEETIIFENSKILIVDDITYNRDLVVSFLENYDLQLFEASSGEFAINAAKEYMPDLIFMDIRMPGLNGYDVTKILRSDENTKQIPVVALTASSMKSETDEINRLFDGYLRKPVRKKQLINEMTKHLPYQTSDEKVKPAETGIEDTAPYVDEQIKKMFRDTFADDLKDLTDLMIIDDLKKFADNVSSFALGFSLTFLEKVAEKLKEEIAELNFNEITDIVEEMKKTFDM